MKHKTGRTIADASRNQSDDSHLRRMNSPLEMIGDSKDFVSGESPTHHHFCILFTKCEQHVIRPLSAIEATGKNAISHVDNFPVHRTFAFWLAVRRKLQTHIRYHNNKYSKVKKQILPHIPSLIPSPKSPKPYSRFPNP